PRSSEESSAAMERGEPLRRWRGIIDARNPRTVRHNLANRPDLYSHGHGNRRRGSHRRPGAILAAGRLAVARPDMVGRGSVAGVGDRAAHLCDAGLWSTSPKSYCPAIPRARGVPVRAIMRGFDTPVQGSTQGPNCLSICGFMSSWTETHSGVYIAHPDHGG